MVNRIRADFRLSIVFSLGMTAAATLLAFMVYRFVSGDAAKGLLDAVIIACILAPVAYGWKTGDSARAGAVMCVLNSINCALACWLIGAAAAPWVYLVLMTNFFIAQRRLAIVASILLIVVATLLLHGAESTMTATSRTVTWCFVTMFSYVFASRVNRDRSALVELATLDALTQVPNRRSMEAALSNAIIARRADDARAGLLVIDIDKFKSVNDAFGHPAGDAVLADLASVLKFEMRSGDSVYRFGGEEFVVLVSIDDVDALASAGERIRKSLRDNVRSPGGRVTVSIGGAMIDDAQQWQDWFGRADEALYRAKALGGDVCRILGGDAVDA